MRLAVESTSTQQCGGGGRTDDEYTRSEHFGGKSSGGGAAGLDGLLETGSVSDSDSGLGSGYSGDTSPLYSRYSYHKREVEKLTQKYEKSMWKKKKKFFVKRTTN